MSRLNSLTPAEASDIVRDSPFFQSIVSPKPQTLASPSPLVSRSPSPPPSCIVKLNGLKKNPELNNKFAIVGDFDGERYYVIPIKKDGSVTRVLPNKMTGANLNDIQGGGRKRKSRKNMFSKRTKRTKRTNRTKRTKRNT